MVDSREDEVLITEDHEEEERDLLLQQSDREETVLQFLQALNLQVIGACRADERLIPLLKTNVSNCAAEDRFLAHLIQHFEAQEIGLLARCLCMPLVSIRVGRIIKQGNLLCPTAVRGNLNLTLLPSSNLRISFTGDDGISDRLATLSSSCNNSAVMIDEIPADTAGRSFVLKLPSRQVYFWCSEKSKLLGNELLAKMKDVLERKPSLAELTGISEMRLDCFSAYFCEYLLGSTVTNTQANQIATPVTLLDTAVEPSEQDSSFQVSSSSLNISFPQHNSTQTLKVNSFSEDYGYASTSMMEVAKISSIDNKKSLEGSKPSSAGLGSLNSNTEWATLTSSNQLLQGLASLKDPAGGSYFSSPYYCPHPPCPLSLQNAEVPPHLTNSFADSFPLPPLSSLLSGTRSLNSFATLNTPHNLLDVTSLDLTAFISDPAVQLPLSISLATVPTSQQIPTFTPLICDSIVHIPTIGVCSSGQGYLVGAGHAVPTSIPLHPHMANPSISDSESMLEKGARETLQLLLSSAQTNPWSRDMLPAVLTRAVDIHEHEMLDAVSHNQWTETTEVDAFANNSLAMDFVSLPNKTLFDIKRRYGADLDSSNQSEGSEGLKGSYPDDMNNDAIS